MFLKSIHEGMSCSVGTNQSKKALFRGRRDEEVLPSTKPAPAIPCQIFSKANPKLQLFSYPIVDHICPRIKF